MVLGNKRDLEPRKITSRQIEEFQASNSEVIYMECSARTGFQVPDSFKALTV